jgi:hypothetical protein
MMYGDQSYFAHCPECDQTCCVGPADAGTIWQCRACGYRFRIPFNWAGLIARIAGTAVLLALLGLSLLCCQGMSCMVRYHDANHPAQ